MTNPFIIFKKFVKRSLAKFIYKEVSLLMGKEFAKIMGSSLSTYLSLEREGQS